MRSTVDHLCYGALQIFCIDLNMWFLDPRTKASLGYSLLKMNGTTRLSRCFQPWFTERRGTGAMVHGTFQ